METKWSQKGKPLYVWTAHSHVQPAMKGRQFALVHFKESYARNVGNHWAKYWAKDIDLYWSSGFTPELNNARKCIDSSFSNVVFLVLCDSKLHLFGFVSLASGEIEISLRFSMPVL